MISRETIERVKREVSLLDIVAESVELKRQGRNHVGLCPFHSEKSPSFMVHESSEHYHCFGCGASGNVISFIMGRRGIGFPEAVRDLAERYGIEIKYEGNQRVARQGSDLQALYILHEQAQQYFTENLKQALKKPDLRIKEYIEKRKLNRDSIENFFIGYAPDTWGGLSDFLIAKGATVELLLKSGLVARTDQGKLYDRFRGRLMFPISIDRKRIIAFGGRIIPALQDPAKINSVAKYLNSPETELYRKSKTLYGVPQAIEAIRRTGVLYLVEGYMDVIGLWQRGVKNVVATCGTAVTEEHVQRIKHLAQRVIVLFDGDSAGKQASAKLFQVFLNSTLDGVAKFLPQNEDPDVFAERIESEQGNLEQALASLRELPLFESYIENLIEQHVQNGVLSPALKGKIAAQIANLTLKVENIVERHGLLERASARLMVSSAEFGQLASGAYQHSEQRKIVSSSENSASQSAVQIKSSFLSPQKMDRLDQELLRALITRRELINPFLNQYILSSNGVVSEIREEVVHFLSELNTINLSEQSIEEKRDSTLELLRVFGDDWISFWKQAHDMQNDQRVDLNKSYQECLNALKRKKMRAQIIMIEQEILVSQDQEYKARLAQEKISILRKMSDNLHSQTI